ncbi:ABC transporter permease [Streptomyces sp. WAC 00631]|uniref:ABC transporter permease n=1 Tax=Streptomyces sp. WAC 00631 TaxID=2203201 RepID=UPI000F794940|nr:ABC transporter permease [Streptomyces sp. WAC 00631]MCC5033198.1 ABC transporter permease [Streptomyces sp. WAC 00631]
MRRGAEAGVPPRAVAGLRAYVLITAMWVRSTMVYRTSFLLTALGNFATTALDFVAILLMFSHVEALGGFGFAEVALLYGTSGTAFGLAHLLLGGMDGLGARVRRGSLDAMLVRPVPLLAQVAADGFKLRRIGRLAQGLLVLGWSLAVLEAEWTPLKVLMVPVTVVSGAAIFGALLVAGGSFQFWAQDAAEVQNSFTYGGTTMLQYPPTVFARDLVAGTVFVVPLAFVNWLPVLFVLGRDDPLGLPGWVDFLSPLVAVVCWVPAGLVWRAGLGSYRSAGS